MNKLDNLTFMQLWEEYDQYIKIKLKHQSYIKEKASYTNHIVPYFKDYLVKDITSIIYINWMSNIEEKNYSYSYKKNLHGFMVAILNYAIKFYDLKDNIASKIGGFNKNKDKRKNIDFWTLEEFERFISFVDDDLYKLFFNTLYFTGLRIGECIALTWDDFKVDYLDINKTIAKGKDKNGEYIINSPKTPSSYRKIKLDDQLVNAFNELFEAQKNMENFDTKWFIFGGVKPLSQTTIHRKKNKYCELANVKKIRLHDFRHSHATFLLSNKVPITIISQRLGHSDLALTLNTYSHFLPRDEKKAISLINSIKSNDLYS